MRRLISGLFVFAVFLPVFSLAERFSAKGLDELYQGRIAALKMGIELNYHPSVKTYIDEYLANPDQIKQLISRSKYYFPILEKSLKSKGLPVDLKYIAAASSSLDPLSVQQNGSSGIWNMSYQVAKMYKLKVTTYIDERRDPVKSSQIAAQHLRDLFSIYKSWQLAIAAYGCSPVQLNKSIHAAGNSLYYWDLYKTLPSNCRDLYSKIIATVYVLNYYKEHGIKQVDALTFPVCDTIRVNKWLSFQQISSTMEIDPNLLRNLNPMFRKEIVPFSAGSYFIRVPADKTARFALLRDSVYKPIGVVEFDPVAIQTEQESPPNNEVKQDSEAPKKERTKRVYYTVKRGDNIGDIADWFDTSVQDVKKWNKIRGSKLNAGQRLQLFVPASKSGYYNRINKLSAAKKRSLKRKD